VAAHADDERGVAAATRAGTDEPPPWTGTRLARPARDLARSSRFYGDLLGLPVVGGFAGHAGYDAVFIRLPGGPELELTAGPAQPAASTDEDLLVLYVTTDGEMAKIGARLEAAGVTRVGSPTPTGTVPVRPSSTRTVTAWSSQPSQRSRRESIRGTARVPHSGTRPLLCTTRHELHDRADGR
jgi:catechol 2,3-dioxygenase-like lactoylglutathione lyase family enzyme